MPEPTARAGRGRGSIHAHKSYLITSVTWNQERRYFRCFLLWREVGHSVPLSLRVVPSRRVPGEVHAPHAASPLANHLSVWATDVIEPTHPPLGTTVFYPSALLPPRGNLLPPVWRAQVTSITTPPAYISSYIKNYHGGSKAWIRRRRVLGVSPDNRCLLKCLDRAGKGVPELTTQARLGRGGTSILRRPCQRALHADLAMALYRGPWP